tara:strand:+ start:557 stop:805 length:249 start_codon:yes stop_codon:yes gene_type:complete
MDQSKNENLVSSIIDIVKEATRNNQINENTSRDNLPAWDSLAYMSIIAEVEVNYDIEITEENISSFDSIKSIVEIIKDNNKE